MNQHYEAEAITAVLSTMKAMDRNGEYFGKHFHRFADFIEKALAAKSVRFDIEKLFEDVGEWLCVYSYKNMDVAKRHVEEVSAKNNAKYRIVENVIIRNVIWQSEK